MEQGQSGPPLMAKEGLTMEKVQIILDDNKKPAFAVVPWAEYERMKAAGDEDAQLIALATPHRGEESFPANIARRLAAGEVPLRVIREWRGLTQQQLGDKALVQPMYISQIERSARNLGHKTAMKLAPALGVSVDVLLDDSVEIPFRFAVGQKWWGENTSSIAEVIQIDDEGRKGLVEVRDDTGRVIATDWAVMAQFRNEWMIVPGGGSQ
jgi:transcriptional regulator with XRE-family HTH domain